MKNKSLAAKTPADVRKLSRATRLFVRFKSKTCPHCVTSQPGWDALVKKLNGHKLAPGCVVGEIESALAGDFQCRNEDGTPFQVGGVPAYEFFENGTCVPLEPPGRDAASLMQALQNQNFIDKKEKKGGSRRRKRSRRARTRSHF